MDTIKYIQNLVQQLSNAPKSDYNAILNAFDFEALDFKPFESWSDKKYTRNCLYRDEAFELLLLCWKEGQKTSIHGHGGEDCWVYLLEGEMHEVFYNLDNNGNLIRSRSQHIKPHQQTFMNDKIGFHKLQNSNRGKTLSLHLYAKPIENCRFYDEDSSQFVKKKLKYDTIQNDLLISN